MDSTSLKYIAAALALFPLFGVGLGLGNLFSTYLASIARNPDEKQELFSRALLGVVMVELLALLSFVVSMLILRG